MNRRSTNRRRSIARRAPPTGQHPCHAELLVHYRVRRIKNVIVTGLGHRALRRYPGRPPPPPRCDPQRPRLRRRCASTLAMRRSCSTKTHDARRARGLRGRPRPCRRRRQRTHRPACARGGWRSIRLLHPIGDWCVCTSSGGEWSFRERNSPATMRIENDRGSSRGGRLSLNCLSPLPGLRAAW